jgi:hypothetical protein
MQHRIWKLATLVLLCLASSRAHGDRPSQPAFDLGDFSHPLTIDNRYLPLPVGLHIVYSEVEGDECAVDDFVVTAATKDDFQGAYAGLSARVVSDRVWLDADCDGGRDLLLEDTLDWHAQDDAGNVWYVGEDTSAFEYDEAGQLIGTSHEGAWEAGRDGAVAGLVMLAEPTKGAAYQQEFSAGIAEDAAKVKQVGADVSIGLGDFSDCVVTRESTRLAPGDVEYKSYCPDLGLLLVEAHGNKGAAEAIDIALP